MLLHRLCSLARIYPRRLAAVQQPISHLGQYLPATLVQATRSYARKYDDDDDDDFFQQSFRSEGHNRPNRYSGDGGKRDFGGGNRGNDRFANRQSFGRPQSRQSFGGFQNRSQFGQQRNQQQQQLNPINWSQRELTTFEKDFYKPDARTLERSDAEVKQFRDEHNIVVPTSAPKPIISFDELTGLPEEILKTLQRDNFAQCTPIQAQGMPVALSGQNMVGIAQTG